MDQARFRRRHSVLIRLGSKLNLPGSSHDLGCAAAHQRSGQLDSGQPSKVRATARTGAAMGRDMEDMVRRLAGAAGGQVELIDNVIP